MKDYPYSIGTHVTEQEEQQEVVRGDGRVSNPERGGS